MKKKTVRIVCALLLAALIPLSLITADLLLPDYYSESYYAALSSMVRRLDSAPGNRLIVLGNSDVAFGLDGALLEEMLAEKGLSYTVCPFGLYGAVGMSAMLSLSQGALKKGDVVVLVCEPVSDALSAYFGASAFWKCAESSRWLLPRVGEQQRSALWGNYLSYLQEKMAIASSGEAPRPSGVYAKAAFDGRCDLTYPRPGNALPLGYDTSSPVDLREARVSADFAAQIKAYCEEAKKAGAKVCVSFSPVNALAVLDSSPEAVKAFFDEINRAFPCPVISDPNRYILASGRFYDTNFHLNTAGARLRTCLLAEELLPYLGCYSPVAYERPAMPPSAAALPQEGEDDGSFLFAATPDGRGWLICGVSEAGQKKESLSVPAFHEGLPVAGFADGALKNAGSMAELRLPASIEDLPDGVFRDCASLRRVVFSHREAPCRVHPDTFQGTANLRVFVPDTDYVLYRDGVGCEANPWAEHLDRVFRYSLQDE